MYILSFFVDTQNRTMSCRYVSHDKECDIDNNTLVLRLVPQCIDTHIGDVFCRRFCVWNTQESFPESQEFVKQFVKKLVKKLVSWDYGSKGGIDSAGFVESIL